MSDDGGMAFPCQQYNGMTLRDYFAGQALPAAITITVSLSEITTGKPETFAANMAYEMADAMLEARKK